MNAPYAEQGPVPQQYEAGAYYVGDEGGGYAGMDANSGWEHAQAHASAWDQQGGYGSAHNAPLPAQFAGDDAGQALFAHALREEQERAGKKGKVRFVCVCVVCV